VNTQLKDIIPILERIAPPELAEQWDNSGLQIGAPATEIRSILVAMDITGGVVREAERRDACLIVTHHPLLFHPLKQILTQTGIGRLIRRIVKAGISVYAAHTNLDAVSGGVNDMLGRELELQSWKPLLASRTENGCGIGGIGESRRERSVKSFAEEIKARFGLSAVRLIGRPEKRVKRIAFCSGSGSSLIPEIARTRPDLYVTGDLGYHDARSLEALEISAIDIGHFGSEQGIRKILARRLRSDLKKTGRPIPVTISRSEHDPFTIL